MPVRLRRLCVVLLLVAMGFSTSAFARIDTRSLSADPPMVTLEFNDTIDPTDLARFQNVIAGMEQVIKATGQKQYGLFVRLNSDGGDVATAMKLGRLIRKHAYAVAVESGASCVSSCVFLLAAGQRRTIEDGGKVGIHRPYQAEAVATSPDAEQKKYAAIGQAVEAYLRDMNVDPRLYADMLRISPQRVRYLSDQDMINYGLLGDDPYVEEADAMEEAKRLGISRAELVRRKAIESQVCGGYPNNKNSPQYDALMVKRLECGNRVLKKGR